MGVSRRCAHKWWTRYLDHGEAGLVDRSSRPRHPPTRTPERVEARIVGLRREGIGPERIGARLNVTPSTVHQVLLRHGLNRLERMDRATGRVIRRYERARPGELIHIDVKKLGKIPPGGGHKVHGRQAARPLNKRSTRIGDAYVHSAEDDHSRLAYSEVLADEKGATAAAFWRRAETWFRAHGILVERVLTDNAFCYRGILFNEALAEHRIAHRYCRPYRPQTNGKVERFNRTLLEEWAYVRVYFRACDRTRALARWLHMYNHHRPHTSGRPPISRVTNVPGRYLVRTGVCLRATGP